MIINITYGGNAPASARYIQGAAKGDKEGTRDRARLLGSHGFGFPVQSRDDVRLALDVMARDIELQASNTKPISNTVIHTSHSWPLGYQPSRREMLEAPDHLARAWGMEEARRITWSHSDTKHRHVHTLFDPVHPVTGRAFHDHERNDRAQRAAIDWERKHPEQKAPARQRDHDIANAAEVSDHVRTMDRAKSIDGSISERQLNRALSLGGKFGSEKIAERKEFIDQNNLTKSFPRHRERTYSTEELAKEKQDYIDHNKEHSRGLQRAHNREKAVGIIRDIEDWPWKKLDELKNKLQDKVQDALDRRRPNDPAARRRIDERTREAWESQHGPVPQQSREERDAEAARVKNWETQRERKERREHPIRLAIDKLAGKTRDDSILPWRKDEQRSEAWRREQEMRKAQGKSEQSAPQQQAQRPRETPNLDPNSYLDPNGFEKASRLAKWYEDQMKRPRPEHPQPLPRQESQQDPSRQTRREPRREPPQQQQQSQHQPPQQKQEAPQISPPRDRPMPQVDPPKRWRDRILDTISKKAEEKIAKENAAREAEGKRERRFQDGIDQAQGRGERAGPDPQQGPVDRFGYGPSEGVDGFRRHEKPKEQPMPQHPNQDNRTPQQVKADEHGMIGREGDPSGKQRQRAEDFYRDEHKPEPDKRTPNQRILDGIRRHQAQQDQPGPIPQPSQAPEPDPISRNRQILNRLREQQGEQPLPYSPQESSRDGTAGQGRREPEPQPAPRQAQQQVPQQSFQDQLNQSQRNIQVPKREIERDQEMER